LRAVLTINTIGLTKPVNGWDNPTRMHSIVRTDSKRRIRLPQANPGDYYQVVSSQSGDMTLIKINATEPTEVKSEEQVEQILAEEPLRFTQTWEQLRSTTREP
jgi:hypothetical protein